MQFVCNDLDGKSPWHFDENSKTYFRCFDNGKHTGMIKGEHLPNPIERPITSETTYKLWNHWNANNHN